MSDIYESLMDDPLNLIDSCYSDVFELTPEQTAEIQLNGARQRFAELRPQLSVLNKLATEQGIDELNELNDIAPLLFPHTVYKSYPMAQLERGNFGRLTRWLQGLTTVDLSDVEAEDIQTIDGWLDELDKKTPLRVFHSSGTTGKLSFMPRTEDQWRDHMRLRDNVIRNFSGPNSGPAIETYPVIQPTFRYGAGTSQRSIPIRLERMGGREKDMLFMYPKSRYSADLLSLSGRVKTAEARGELGQLEIAPALLKRRDELARMESERPAELARFFDTLVQDFAGKDVLVLAIWTVLYAAATEGKARGLGNLFSDRSVLITGGGKKGQNLPDDFQEICLDFLGPAKVYEMYGMSEWLSPGWRCEHDNYHLPPTLVPFLLDPVTGQAMARTDGQVGRFAALDLLTISYWAGLITGDEVTISGWQEPCSCARKGVYVHPTIRRYSEQEGGDDRILCAGAPAAHDSAAAFLAQIAG